MLHSGTWRQLCSPVSTPAQRGMARLTVRGKLGGGQGEVGEPELVSSLGNFDVAQTAKGSGLELEKRYGICEKEDA